MTTAASLMDRASSLVLNVMSSEHTLFCVIGDDSSNPVTLFTSTVGVGGSIVLFVLASLVIGVVVLIVARLSPVSRLARRRPKRPDEARTSDGTLEESFVEASPQQAPVDCSLLADYFYSGHVYDMELTALAHASARRQRRPQTMSVAEYQEEVVSPSSAVSRRPSGSGLVHKCSVCREFTHKHAHVVENHALKRLVG